MGQSDQEGRGNRRAQSLRGWNRRVREMTVAAKLSALLGNRTARDKPSSPHDGWLAVIVGVVVGFVIGYLCGSLFG